MSFFNSIPEPPLDPPEDTRRRVYSCAICGEDILEGDDYYDIPGFGKCCEGCIDDAKCYEAEFEGPDPDTDYDSRGEEV